MSPAFRKGHCQSPVPETSRHWIALETCLLEFNVRLYTVLYVFHGDGLGQGGLELRRP